MAFDSPKPKFQWDCVIASYFQTVALDLLAQESIIMQEKRAESRSRNVRYLWKGTSRFEVGMLLAVPPCLPFLNTFFFSSNIMFPEEVHFSTKCRFQAYLFLAIYFWAKEVNIGPHLLIFFHKVACKNAWISQTTLQPDWQNFENNYFLHTRVCWWFPLIHKVCAL